MSTPLDRRAFLQLSGALAGAATLGCTPGEGDDATPPPARAPVPTDPWPGVAEPSADYPVGVASGDPDGDKVVLWTRATGEGEVQASWSTWDGAAWSDPVSELVTLAEGGYAHHDLVGLPPDTWVAFQFHGATGGSVVGQFVTPPDRESTADVRLAATSCLSQSRGRFPCLAATVARGPIDAFVFLGDTAYFDSLDTREEFRALYARNLSAEGFREVLRSTPCVYTWDDHEFTNNFDPETLPEARKTLAVEAWHESLPVRRNPEHPDRIWRSFRFGRTVELFVLDCRTERVRSEGLYVSPEQLQWLIDGVQASECTWKVIANSVPILDFTSPAWDLPGIAADRWEGYPDQRSALVEALNGVGGVVFVSGDVHCGILGRLDREGAGRSIWDVVCGPGGSPLNITASFLIDDDQIPWAAAVHHATRLVFTHAGRLRGEVVGEDDQTWASFELDADGVLRALTWTDPLTGQTITSA